MIRRTLYNIESPERNLQASTKSINQMQFPETGHTWPIEWSIICPLQLYIAARVPLYYLILIALRTGNMGLETTHFYFQLIGYFAALGLCAFALILASLSG